MDVSNANQCPAIHAWHGDPRVVLEFPKDVIHSEIHHLMPKRVLVERFSFTLTDASHPTEESELILETALHAIPHARTLQATEQSGSVPFNLANGPPAAGARHGAAPMQENDDVVA